MIPDLTNASPETREYYALPQGIRDYVKSIVGIPPRPMSTMEIMLAIGQAMMTAPKGWKLVPIEPTPDMIEAGRIARLNAAGGYDGPSGWEAMLNAAPEPAGGEG